MMMKKRLSLLFFLLISCDFTTSIHRDILKAQEHFQEKDYKKAIGFYKSVVEKRVDKELRVKVLYQLAEIYSNYEADYQTSLDYYQKIIDLNPEVLWQVKVYEKMAEVYFLLVKNYKKSYEIYEKLYEFKPSLENSDLYRYRMGLSLFYNNEFGRSLKVFDEISKSNLHAYFKKAKYYIGLINFYKQNWKDSIEQWKDYLKYEQDNIDAVNVKFLIANAYEMLEDLKSAYNIYYSILPDYPNPKVIEKRLRSLYERRVARKR